MTDTAAFAAMVRELMQRARELRPDGGLTAAEISKETGTSLAVEEVSRQLKRLARDGEITRGEGGRWYAPLLADEVEGRLSVRSGSFLVEVNGTQVEILPDHLGEAIAGDQVSVQITFDNGRGLRAGIVRRVTDAIPRRFDARIMPYQGQLIATAAGVQEPMVLKGEGHGRIKPGEILQVEVKGRTRIPRAAGLLPPFALTVAPVVDQPRFSVDPRVVFPKLDPTERNATVLLDQLARAMGLDQPFSAEALETASRSEPPVEPGAGDWDLREVPLVTIDGETAKDFDDAVYAQELGDVIRLLVAVADVSAYVPEGDPLDRDARLRGTSVYLPGRVYPMLPSRLSDDLCSLRPHVPRRCAWVSMLIQQDGTVVDVAAGFGVMKSAARLTYAQVQQFLDGNDLDVSMDVQESLMALDEARERLYRHRLSRGMLDLDRPEPTVALSPDGSRVENILPHPRYRAHRLIEECMVAANEAIARFLSERHWPAPTRVHGDPDPAKIAHVRDVASGLGIRIPLSRRPDIDELSRVLAALEGTPMAQVMSYLILRSVPRAEYAIDGKGHFGLGAEHYLHFTSPIRRYPDLMAHRLLRRALSEPLPAGAVMRKLRDNLQAGVDASNKGEERAKKAERFAERMLRARVMLDHVGDEFDATVSDMAAWGLFITIANPYVEGTVPIRRLGREYMEFDDVRMHMQGSRTGETYRLGDRLRVKCVSVDLSESRVLFDVVARLAADPARPAGQPVAPQRRHPEPDRAQHASQGERTIRHRRAGEPSAPHERRPAPVIARNPLPAPQTPAPPQEFYDPELDMWSSTPPRKRERLPNGKPAKSAPNKARNDKRRSKRRGA
jgi:ribonuclease R